MRARLLLQVGVVALGDVVVPRGARLLGGVAVRLWRRWTLRMAAQSAVWNQIHHYALYRRWARAQGERLRADLAIAVASGDHASI